MTESATTPGARTPRVLIVDDAMIIRKRIRDIAVESGWQIAGEAGTGHEAVDLYLSERPDLVTMDIVMPEMDGVDALRQIVEIDTGAQVVMVSAVNQKNKLAQCIQAGAVDFIVKPFEKADLQSFFAQQRSKMTQTAGDDSSSTQPTPSNQNSTKEVR